MQGDSYLKYYIYVAARTTKSVNANPPGNEYLWLGHDYVFDSKDEADQKCRELNLNPENYAQGCKLKNYKVRAYFSSATPPIREDRADNTPWPDLYQS